MKWKCSTCEKEREFVYSDYKWLIRKYGIVVAKQKNKFSSVEYSTCTECKYKNKLPMIPLIYREGEDKYKSLNLIKNYNESLYLLGDAGSGKTYLATLILKKLWRDGLEGTFLSYPEFIFSIQTDYENKSNLVDEYKTFFGCLVIDDFGAEKMTDFVRQVSYLLINYREQNRLQTIITSNFTLDEIDQYVDRRISSRIAGMCRIIKMSGDKRLKRQEINNE